MFLCTTSTRPSPGSVPWLLEIKEGRLQHELTGETRRMIRARYCCYPWTKGRTIAEPVVEGMNRRSLNRSIRARFRTIQLLECQ